MKLLTNSIDILNSVYEMLIGSASFQNQIVTGCVLFEKISHTVLFQNDR